MPEAQSEGRKRRSKGEQTRELILDGALRVIAREGLRGITHRAVAAEAGVQLSLTTYYFKDIGSLIQETFELFCARSRPTNEQIWGEIFTYLDSFSSTELRKTAVREAIATHLSQRATEILLAGIIDNPVGLAVEQIFFTTVLQSPSLRELASVHRQTLLAPLVEICRRFNKRDPELDAQLLLDTMTRLEYEALAVGLDTVDKDRMRRLLRRQIGWALGLKSS